MALTDNLVAYWKMDAASGNESDSVGSNTLVSVVDPGSVSGLINNARSFVHDNSNSMSCADNSDISTGDIDFSWAFWINFQSKDDFNAVISKDETNEDEYLCMYQNSGSIIKRIAWFVSANGTTFTTLKADTFGEPSLSTWYHVVCWHDSVANQLGICVNAGTADTVSYSSGVRNGASALRAGKGAGGGGFGGYIDEIGFWKRVLTSGERTQLYNSGAGLAYPFSSGSVITRLALLGVG